MNPSQVSRYNIREAIAGKSERRTTMFLQRLRAIFGELVDDGMVAKNPGQSVKNPKRGPREPIEGLTTVEQAALLNAATGQDRNFIVLAIATGLRPGEIGSIQRKDVDLERQRMVVRGTKTEGSARVIELQPAAVKALRAQLQLNRRLHAPLFANNRGDGLDYTNWRERNWTAIIKRAGLEAHTPYAMRHTFAITMLERGHDPVYAARQLGHTRHR